MKNTHYEQQPIPTYAPGALRPIRQISTVPVFPPWQRSVKCILSTQHLSYKILLQTDIFSRHRGVSKFLYQTVPFFGCLHVQLESSMLRTTIMMVCAMATQAIANGTSYFHDSWTILTRKNGHNVLSPGALPDCQQKGRYLKKP